MRIDFVITELNIGGAEKTLTEIALAMARRGHEVRVLSIGSRPSSNRRGLVDRLEAKNIETEFGGFDHWTSLFAATRWLRRCLSGRRPDICQTFLFHANCLGVDAAKRAGVQRILGGLRVAESNRLRALIERRAVAKMETLVCVSAQVQRFAESELDAESKKCVVIPNGVDVDAYRDTPPIRWETLGWPNESKVALFVGRLHPQKGLERIQQQATRLLDGANRHLLIIGDGPLSDSLRTWAEPYGDRVRMLGFQPNVGPYLKAARLLLLPSHYEGMPNVVLEAMAAGIPVVCSRVEGSEELLGDQSSDRAKKQGFDPGNAGQMAQLAEALFVDDGLVKSIGAANQNAIRSGFSLETMVQAYTNLYENGPANETLPNPQILP
ncbi:MAG: glycosyltransferase [Planctomycetota bacterium]